MISFPENPQQSGNETTELSCQPNICNCQESSVETIQGIEANDQIQYTYTHIHTCSHRPWSVRLPTPQTSRQKDFSLSPFTLATKFRINEPVNLLVILIPVFAGMSRPQWGYLCYGSCHALPEDTTEGTRKKTSFCLLFCKWNTGRLRWPVSL